MNAVVTSPHPVRRTARRPRGQLLFRSLATHVYAYLNRTSEDAAADHLFRSDYALHGYLAVQRAVTNPAVTAVPEWAGNLARETWDGFVALLAPVSVYAQLSALGTSLTFERGKVRFPARSASSKLAGDFVGENAPIPVRKGSVLVPSLTPKKVAVITAYSTEMDFASGAGMEAFLRTAILEDTAPVLDARLLDSNPATAVRPAGLLNGVTLTPSAGTTPADIAADLKAAITPILDAGGGRRVVVLMNPSQALTLSLTTVWSDASRRLVADVIVSPNVPAGTIIALDAAEFATAADPAPRFEVSEDGLLHLDDAPEQINDGTMATPVVSLFQTNLLALRMIQLMNWTMRRPGMVAGVSGITW